MCPTSERYSPLFRPWRCIQQVERAVQSVQSCAPLVMCVPRLLRQDAAYVTSGLPGIVIRAKVMEINNSHGAAAAGLDDIGRDAHPTERVGGDKQFPNGLLSGP